MRQFQKDLAIAQIPYKDALGRQADFHALRKTLATNLNKMGVAPRVAMELMRHSDIKLTMKNYTDSSQLPTFAAIEQLPWFNSPLSKDTQIDSQILDTTVHNQTQKMKMKIHRTLVLMRVSGTWVHNQTQWCTQSKMLRR